MSGSSSPAAAADAADDPPPQKHDAPPHRLRMGSPSSPRWPMVGATVVVVRTVDGTPHVLLGQRINPDGHGDGTWQLPGGKLDWMEDLDVGAKREVEEETGLELSGPLKKLSFTNDRWPDARNKDGTVGRHFVTLYLEYDGPLDVAQLENREPTKCREWQWWPVTALPIPLFCGTLPVLRERFGGNFDVGPADRSAPPETWSESGASSV